MNDDPLKKLLKHNRPKPPLREFSRDQAQKIWAKIKHDQKPLWILRFSVPAVSLGVMAILFVLMNKQNVHEEELDKIIESSLSMSFMDDDGEDDVTMLTDFLR